MAATVTSYDNATVGQGNIVNQVELAYNSFAQLTSDYQSHSGAVNTSMTPRCQYGYAGGSGNTTRLTMVTYPNGRNLNYSYGTAGGNEDAASRVASLIDNDGSTHLVDYSYLGLSNTVLATSPQASLQYTLVGTAGGIDPDTGDIYRGYDRFTRVKDLIWYNTATAQNLAEIQHGYDRVGNRVYRADPVDAADQHDELYAYDGIHRLNDLIRGSLNAGKTGIINPTFAECWSLDSSGNWPNFRQASTGGAWDLIQYRTDNPANEITLVTTTAGPAWVTPAYDKAGNMTTIPQPALPTSSYTATYDAWNRPVALSAGGSTVAIYQYDALKRRIVKKRYTGGVLSETRHFFYSSEWQVLEERVGTSTSAQRQFVWGTHYIDDLVLRDRDTTGAGTLNERLYAFQDPNWNVTGVVDTTGAVKERYGFASYGVPSFLTSAFISEVASAYDWETLFAGYRWDAETGLYHVRKRAYAPHLGVFLQRDVLGLLEELNVYMYALDSPGNRTDPMGDPFLLLFLAACALTVLAAGTTYYATGSWQAGAVVGLYTAAAIITAITFLPSGGASVTLLPSALGALGGTTIIQVSAAVAATLAVGITICYSVSPTCGRGRGPDIGPCEFYLLWCKWGVSKHQGERGWTQGIGNCETCYEECKTAGNKWNSWPLRQCPIAGSSQRTRGPRWPSPRQRFGGPLPPPLPD